ncbi:putative selenate ABC transporter substrate-binding protein [Pseudomaricurvus alcaniphilus]|uniref:putative selenate ABC transporter substrate-binding protein n=1 Tax=Pseudomaricurvus alcaniphilus TaxID=1166482 RepID=UPI00140E3C5D|nr:putative selenate ABC transporter substrate-binding protein [Pseudomaricurvus alcaniphilus]NHN36036.1 putative selenate ABC transporter substrate-binding protein [Pseudomaricurvus alcaniphilus]
MRLLTVLTALLISSLTSPLLRAEVFTFTAIPDQDETRLQERFDKVANYLERELGVPVRYLPVKSYPAAVTAFRNNQVQLAWFGGLSGVQARQLVPGSKAIAQGYEDQFFKSYFIAHKSSGLLKHTNPGQFPDAIRDKTFTFGSKGSTSGRLMPEYYIRQHFQAAPQQVFSRVGFSGDHSRTIALVQAGAYQVGAVNYQVWETALAEGKVDTQQVGVIWQTPSYPDYQWTVRGDADQAFGAGFTARLQRTLLALQDPEILATFPRQSFVTASNDDFAPVEATAIAIGLLDAE